jgi:ribonuclease HII
MIENRAMIAGVDEAGRGPLAGPVVVSAVILDPRKPIEGLADSKKISAKKRLELFSEITKKSISYSIYFNYHLRVDEINILAATLEGMRLAVLGLAVQPEQVLVDGNCCPELPMPVEAIIKGDQKIAAISAASILAKVSRDQFMLEQDVLFPQYGFAQHKGYGTKAHMAALEQHGPCEIHRMSFAPVRRAAAMENSGS